MARHYKAAAKFTTNGQQKSGRLDRIKIKIQRDAFRTAKNATKIAKDPKAKLYSKAELIYPSALRTLVYPHERDYYLPCILYYLTQSEDPRKCAL